MPKKPLEDLGALKVWHRIGPKTIYWHFHFSYWGAPQKAEQLTAIGRLIT